VRDPYRAAEILDAELGPHVPTAPRDFVLYSRVPFEFFESGDSAGFFIDARDSARTATPMREHSELFHHPRVEHVLRTLYVPREAVEPLTKRVRAEQRSARGSATGDFGESELLFDALFRPAIAADA
jgi:hypothetical protein